jgi:hypothetical protein
MVMDIAHAATLHEETVRNADNRRMRAAKPRTQTGTTRGRRGQTTAGPVTVRQSRLDRPEPGITRADVDPGTWEAALELAEGDASRLVPLAVNSVLIR